MYRNFHFGDITTNKFGFALLLRGYATFGAFGCDGWAQGLGLDKHKLLIQSTVLQIKAWIMI